MYIRNKKNTQLPEFVSDCEIIAEVYSAYPHIVFLPNLLDFDRFFSTNMAIVQIFECYPQFQKIIDKNFIEVIESDTFDYEHFGFCGTHTDTYSLGYVRRTEETEAMACEGPWDDDYYFW